MKTIRYTVPIFFMLCVTGTALAGAGHDARKEPAAMEGMDHGKMKMDGQGDAVAAGAHWMAPEEAVKRPNPVPADTASRARGKKLFQVNCASCHGAGGRGDGPAGAALNPRPADLTAMAGQHPDGDFAWKIATGRGPMPAWKGVLKDNQIWDLVNHVQSLAPDGAATLRLAAPDGAQESPVSATGVVQQVKSEEGKVKISHEAIPALGWPAMSMYFRVKDKAVLEGVATGDRVRFELEKDAKGLAITRMEKAAK